MISDQCMAMVRDGLFDGEQNSKTKLALKQSDSVFLMPSVLVEAKPATDVEIEFMLVKLNNGMPKHNKFSILKNYDFARFNRKQHPNRQDLQTYLKRYRNRSQFERFANFQLLLYIARELDIHVPLC